MAILAMDQYAHLLVARLPDSVLATTIAEVHDALGKGALPVLAPARWLREADPLPHSWDVTSDSIAAWVAGMLGAPRLVLLKPAGAHGVDAVDRHFAHVLDPGTMHVIVPADRLDTLASALDGHEARR
jgi:dihydroneopterin aldolase